MRMEESYLPTGLEVLIVVTTKIMVLRIATLYSLARADIITCFDYCLLGLKFYPEDGSNMFLQNVGLSPSYMMFQPRIPYASPYLG
jgi:hypothetical protein